mgnify:CR=1 FL=1
MKKLNKKASTKTIVAYWCKCTTNLCKGYYPFTRSAQIAAAEKSNAL